MTDANKHRPDDTEQVIREAEQIRDGVRGRASETGPSDSSPTPEGPGVPPAGPSPFDLARLAVMLTDGLFVGMFGPGAAMQQPLRREAESAWAALFAEYLPALVHLGPVGQLGGVYCLHVLGCYSAWIVAQSASAAAGAAPEKPAS